MRKLYSFLVIATILAISTGKTESLVFSTTDGTTLVRWNLTDSASSIVQNGRVVYNINPAGSDDVPFTQVEAAITSSFKTWEDLATCGIAFTRGANRTETGARNDDIFQIYWRENSTVDDGLDISGALAVTRLYTFTGARAGEIADVSLVFNGKEMQWATDGNPDRIDIAEVATHEIGHVIGLSHTPVTAATMFPRSGEGITRHRTLHSDDQIAASILYPANNFLTATGTLRGRVRDSSGNAMFAANVVVTDGNGNVVATILTQRDGSYRLQGLPPGAHTAFVGPIDPPGGLLFGPDDLNSNYNDAATNFLTSNNQSVTLNAGGETTLDITVTRATPALRAHLVYQSATGGFTNLGTSAQPGQSVTIGVAGPGLPTGGNPLSVSGSGVTIQRTRFATLNNGDKAVLADVIISANAAPGARNLIVTSNGQRTIIVGGLEITGTGASAQPLSIVSAANFSARVAAESIVAAFGSSLATSTLAAVGTPLPLSLAGTSVRIRDSQGNERAAPLFFVSSQQVNYQFPPGIQTGTATVTITNLQGQVSTSNVLIESVAPGLFSATGTGLGPAAAVALRIKANGAQSFENVVRYDSAQGKFVTVPIDLSAATDQVFLILYGTGLRFRSSLNAVVVSAGGANQQVTYAGAQGALVGLDQLNVRLARTLIGRGEVDVIATVDGRVSNTVRVNIK
jgi:uncharacterized protein (TIGR03437 family)